MRAGYGTGRSTSVPAKRASTGGIGVIGSRAGSPNKRLSGGGMGGVAQLLSLVAGRKKKKSSGKGRRRSQDRDQDGVVQDSPGGGPEGKYEDDEGGSLIRSVHSGGRGMHRTASQDRLVQSHRRSTFRDKSLALGSLVQGGSKRRSHGGGGAGGAGGHRQSTGGGLRSATKALMTVTADARGAQTAVPVSKQLFFPSAEGADDGASHDVSVVDAIRQAVRDAIRSEVRGPLASLVR